MPFKLTDKVIFEGNELEIIGKRKGAKTKKPNFHGGQVITGYRSKPCVYVLSNGCEVRGNKLKKVN